LERKEKQKLLSGLPSVDELLKSPSGLQWLAGFPRRIVVEAVRTVVAARREAILGGAAADLSLEAIDGDIQEQLRILSSFSLRRVINATGIVIHTNLGRSVLSERILGNVVNAAAGYSNLEYDLAAGRRGQRHTHTQRLLSEITGAEDAMIVNNNAAAVLLCLNSLAKGREVIVSRGELVEIGGSFRVPDVMSASGACLREVGTTNKTHLHDYANAVNENTALLLKVHQSNYRITGFTEDVKIGEILDLGRQHDLPVMYDLGSGCLIDLRPYGIHDEPSVPELVKTGVDILTFSGDKLLGGPQGGIIVGRKKYLERIRKNPLARAVRVDKFTIAAFEATLMEYLDPDNAKKTIPTLHMLFQSPGEVRTRARRIASGLRRMVAQEKFEVVRDASKAGGGSLPQAEFETFAVSIRPAALSVNELDERLRSCSPPVVGRIRGNALLLDARTISNDEVQPLVKAVGSALQAGL
jgi:L-seryl-tRNA(Ser) seleniumtransferase